MQLQEAEKALIRAEVMRQTFERFWHPTGHNFVPGAVKKIQLIAHHWFLELRESHGNFDKYSKRIARPIILTAVEADILKNVFDKVFKVKVEFFEQGRVWGWIDSCLYGCKYRARYAVKILPKNLVGYAAEPLKKYHVRASWANDNPFIELPRPFSDEPVDQLYVKERCQSRLPPDVFLKIGDQLLPVHYFLLASHSLQFCKSLAPNPMRQLVEISDIKLETMRELITFIYTGSLPDSISSIVELTIAAHKHGFLSCLKACEALLSQKVTHNLEEVHKLAKLLQLKELCEFCESYKLKKCL